MDVIALSFVEVSHPIGGLSPQFSPILRSHSTFLHTNQKATRKNRPPTFTWGTIVSNLVWFKLRQPLREQQSLHRGECLIALG